MVNLQPAHISLIRVHLSLKAEVVLCSGWSLLSKVMVAEGTFFWGQPPANGRAKQWYRDQPSPPNAGLLEWAVFAPELSTGLGKV